ncbi:MAG: glycosyltransferase family 4 protein [Actinomycetia bacterium]|nr:glycosyltransferase family 4 protein [Actinomycetes bacterium]MCP4961003.1 glycosyltransferase family 4 protein [Actinomycetes bacterium]
MRILFVNPGGKAQGGAERSLAQLIGGLAERGHEVHVALMATGDASTLFRDAGAHVAGVVAEELHVAPRHGGAAPFIAGATRAAPAIAGVVKALRKIVLRTSPDVVHSNGFRSHVLSPLFVPRSIPIVWSLRDRAPHQLHRSLLRATSRSVASIIANSPFTADQLRHPAMTVVANPIAEVQTVPTNEARARLGLPDDRHIVAVLAHLHPSKGHDVMVEALTHWSPSVRPILAIAGGDLYKGSDSYGRDLGQRVEALGLRHDVSMLGNVDDVDLVYAAADVVVHPSRHPEGFGRVAVEAQSSGTPIVATAQGGVLGLIDHDETGLLVQPDDPAALFEAVDSVMWPGPRRTRLISKGKTAAARFSPEVHTARVVEIYEKLTALTSNSDEIPDEDPITSSREASLSR